MIKRFWTMLFGGGASLVTVEHDEREREMMREQRYIQLDLGFDPDDSTQGWLRLHQLLKSHEDRITALEGGK